MLRLALAIALLAATPGFAAEWMHCSDAGGNASFDYLPGNSADVLTVTALTITAGEKVWASDPANGPGDPVSVGQAFATADSIAIDALNKDAVRFARLRLSTAREGDVTAIGGTLSVAGQGAWAVSCQPG
jgi:hypothetical protein